MKIHSERTDISETIPNRPANSEIYWLQLRGEAQTIQRVNLRDVCLGDPKAS
jgi:hypothetical protein